MRKILSSGNLTPSIKLSFRRQLLPFWQKELRTQMLFSPTSGILWEVFFLGVHRCKINFCFKISGKVNCKNCKTVPSKNIRLIVVVVVVNPCPGKSIKTVNSLLFSIFHYIFLFPWIPSGNFSFCFNYDRLKSKKVEN